MSERIEREIILKKLNGNLPSKTKVVDAILKEGGFFLKTAEDKTISKNVLLATQAYEKAYKEGKGFFSIDNQATLPEIITRTIDRIGKYPQGVSVEWEHYNLERKRQEGIVGRRSRIELLAAYKTIIYGKLPFESEGIRGLEQPSTEEQITYEKFRLYIGTVPLTATLEEGNKKDAYFTRFSLGITEEHQSDVFPSLTVITNKENTINLISLMRTENKGNDSDYMQMVGLIADKLPCSAQENINNFLTKVRKRDDVRIHPRDDLDRFREELCGTEERRHSKHELYALVETALKDSGEKRISPRMIELFRNL